MWRCGARDRERHIQTHGTGRVHYPITSYFGGIDHQLGGPMWRRCCPSSLPLLVGALLLGAAAAFHPAHPHIVRHGQKPVASCCLLHAKDDDDDDDEDDDDDDYEDDDLTASATANFVPPPAYTFGLNAGKSAPSQRLAMGKSSKDAAHVFVCSNCGSEFIQWVGRCPTCREYNTIQEMKVGRRSSIAADAAKGSQKPRPVFGSSGGGGGDEGDLDTYGGFGGDDDFVVGRKSRSASPRSYADSFGGSGGGSSRSWIDGMGGAPVPVTQVYEAMGTIGRRDGGDDSASSSWSLDEDRLVVPDDNELNTVLGGGMMPGSLILIGGDPGVGKSTLLLQTAGALAAQSSPPRGIGMGSSDDSVRGGQGPVIYVSGEESTTQVASRAARLGIESSELLLVSDNDADRIAETVVAYFDRAYYDQEGESRGIYPPCLLVIDSVQTMTCVDGGNTSPGGVSQVRAVSNLLLRLAKSLNLPVVMIGHVTKEGNVAGPRTVEHMVDAVLYLEGSGRGDGETESIRILRAAKNRFGSSSEVGVYSMNTAAGITGGGGRLVPITDPSSLFLSTRMDDEDVVGCAVSVVLEGLRPMTVEVQALASDIVGGAGSYGRRVVDGINMSRLLLLLAVLQKRYSIRFNRKDVYVNVVSGLSIGEKSFGRNRQASDLDLSVAVSLVSSLTDIPVRSDTAFCGEVGLLGELRSVSGIDKRVKEAQRLGFSRVITPANRKGGRRAKRYNQPSSERTTATSYGIDVIECQTLINAINEGLVSPFKFKSRRKDNASTPPSSFPGKKRGRGIQGSVPFGGKDAGGKDAAPVKKNVWRNVEELLADDDLNEDQNDNDDDEDAFL